MMRAFKEFVSMLRSSGSNDFSKSTRSTRLAPFYGDFLWDEAVSETFGKNDRNTFVDYCIARKDIAIFEAEKYPRIDGRNFRRLAAIREAAQSIDSKGPLRVLDFGGGLGNHYFELRPFFRTNSLNWIVWETKDLVMAGESLNVENRELSFLAEQPVSSLYDLIFASCSFHYLPEPWTWLKKVLFERKPVILDRVPFVEGDKDRLTLQTVDSQFYIGLHPWWFLSRRKLLELIETLDYSVILDWRNPEDEFLLDGTLVEASGICLIPR